MTRFDRRRKLLHVLALGMLQAPLSPALAAAPDAAPLVAAAADLRFALDEIAADFKRATGHDVRIVYGSSGNFRRQIAEGAPFELFLSADEAYVLALAREGFMVDDGVAYAIGRLALVVPAGSPLKLDGELADLAAAVADGRVRRFAIANPEHAPYGRAAREALQKAGAWDAIQGRLVLGENVGAGGAVRGLRLGAGRHCRAVARAFAGSGRSRAIRRHSGADARAARAANGLDETRAGDRARVLRVARRPAGPRGARAPRLRAPAI